MSLEVLFISLGERTQSKRHHRDFNFLLSNKMSKDLQALSM